MMKRKALPLVMVSQIQRSGGTMMSQLFDHHPELCAHFFEIYTGYPNKWDWIDFEFSEPPYVWFEKMYCAQFDQYVEQGGYKKTASNAFAHTELFPFTYCKEAHRAAFIDYLESSPVITNRVVYDAYFFSFFNEWKDGVRGENPKYITGFTPRLTMEPGRAERFFRDYPDGWLISQVRNPLSWYVSAKKHSAYYQVFEHAQRDWLLSVQRALELKSRYPDQVMLLTYESIVSDPEKVMRYISSKLGIEYDPVLTKPTYAGYELYPNSSYNINVKGVVDRTSERIKDLEPEDERRIKEFMLPAYETFKAHVDIQEPQGQSSMCTA